jgi:Na+-transporting methylmalonyl-CoA/oxaloacetate decarboxylase gamma subunit
MEAAVLCAAGVGGFVFCVLPILALDIGPFWTVFFS